MDEDQKDVNQASRHIGKSASRLIPVTHWNRYHDWPPVGGLRHLAFFAEKNGFAKAFLKVGRRLLIDEAEFFRVIQEKNGARE